MVDILRTSDLAVGENRISMARGGETDKTRGAEEFVVITNRIETFAFVVGATRTVRLLARGIER